MTISAGLYRYADPPLGTNPLLHGAKICPKMV